MPLRFGRPEKVLAVFTAAYILLSFVPAPGIISLFVASGLFVSSAWVFVRLTRDVVKRLLWRLRNRLMVAYVFIALVPVVLITTLAFLGAALLGGQISIYLVTSELERRTTALHKSVEYVTERDNARTEWVRDAGPYLASRFPGIEIVIEERGFVWRHPEQSTIEAAPAGWPKGSGLVERVVDKKRALYGWAFGERDGRRVLALFPMTREFLGQLAPDIAESSIVDMTSYRPLLASSLDDAAPSHNRLPPAVNRFDWEIRWGAAIPVHTWETPGQTVNRWLSIRTRWSAVFRTVFAQKVDLSTDLMSILFFTVMIVFVVAEIIALIIGIQLTRTITGTVHDIYEGTMRVRGGDFGHRIPVHGNDQVAELAASFNQMTENMQRLLAVEKERERLQAELEIAREVQNQLYPKTVPDVQTLRLTAACNPARMVSGDYYDYQQIDDDKVAIAIGDVAGKGISAALLMATVQSSFRSQIRGSLELAVAAGAGTRQVAVSTSHLVSHLNKQLYADTSPEKYATFYLGVFDGASSVLTYTNAGHLPPIWIHNGEAHRLEVNGMVVGAFPFAAYGESEVKLDPGDLLVFFTDGVTEPENEYAEQFGEEQLVDMLLKNAHLDDQKIVDCIMDAVREWTGSDELQDDMTLLLVRRR